MADEKYAQVTPHTNGSGDAHEGRLLRLEVEVGDLREDTARVDALVSNLPTQIEHAFERLCDKIDVAVEPVARGVAEITERHNVLAEAVATYDPVIRELVQAKKVRAERVDLWRKAVWAVAAGAVGVLVKELMVVVIKHVSLFSH